MINDNQDRLREANCSRELQAIGEQLTQYTAMANANMRFWGTVRPDSMPEDVVSHCLIQYADKLLGNRMDMAKDDNHAQARFTNFVKNRLHNLTRKKWKENSGTDVEAWTVDEKTFEQTLDLLTQAKGKLKPKDTVRLERILSGEKMKDVIPQRTTQHYFRARVRTVYNAL